jgi:aminopeptidase N
MSIYTISSATLPAPIILESIMHNRQANDFPSLTQSYYRAFGALPTADEAALFRKMIDIDDTPALNTLKTLKATDQAGDLILQSGDRMEDEARVAASASAPFLTAAATAPPTFKAKR